MNGADDGTTYTAKRVTRAYAAAAEMSASWRAIHGSTYTAYQAVNGRGETCGHIHRRGYTARLCADALNKKADLS
jgi:hypothetical protein